jgi:hypothetical protein
MKKCAPCIKRILAVDITKTLVNIILTLVVERTIDCCVYERCDHSVPQCTFSVAMAGFRVGDRVHGQYIRSQW